MHGLLTAICVTLASIPPQKPTAPDTAASWRRGAFERHELEAFLDGLIGDAMTEKHVAGAVVTVVKDGMVLLTKGYGYADIAAGHPVEPARTLFRPGSISKIFTWTAVMQLVEQGKLDLDRDVNESLDFKIPATFPQPVTLRHLMTHTLGVEEDPRGLISDDSTAIRPMKEWLATHMPKRVRPPGLFSSYSNWGTAVAGHIVELKAGVPFSEYVQRQILDPLEMKGSTPFQPLRPQFAPNMSRGYEWSGGSYVAHPFEYLPGAAPAGVMSVTGADMGNFMLAHLQLGRFGDHRILAESTARTMQSRAFGHDDRLAGFALGFYEKNSHGLRIIGHGGDSQWFHSDMALVPSEGLGVYFSTNTNTGGAFSGRPFIERFLDHYYPETLSPSAGTAPPADELSSVVGSYRSNRRSYTTFLKALSLGDAIQIASADSGMLSMSGGSEGVTRLVRVGPLLYRNRFGNDLVAFRRDSTGKVTHLFNDEPMIANERQAWYQSSTLHLTILIGGLIVFLTLVLTAVRSLIGRKQRNEGRSQALGRRLMVLAALANLAFVIGALLLASNLTALIFGDSSGKLEVLLTFPVIGALAAVLALVAAVGQWSSGVGTWRSRAGFTATVLVALLFAWSLNQWNLLWWKV